GLLACGVLWSCGGVGSCWEVTSEAWITSARHAWIVRNRAFCKPVRAAIVIMVVGSYGAPTARAPFGYCCRSFTIKRLGGAGGVGEGRGLTRSPGRRGRGAIAGR